MEIHMINPNEVKREIADKKVAMAALLQATAKTGKDVAGEELKQYNILLADVCALDAKLAQHAAGAFLPGQGAEPSAVIHVSGESFQAAQAGTSRNSSLSHQIQAVYNSASSEGKAQIENLTNYMRGREIRADMASAGGALIPSSVQDVIIRNYAQFDPVRQISKLFTTVSGEPLTFPVLSDSVSAVALAESAATGADATVSGDAPPTSLTGPQLSAYKTSS